MPTTGTNQSFISLENVHFAFGHANVLRDVSLRLNMGITYALIGKSGTGKSTLLDLIAGFLVPDKGTVSINGQQVAGPRKETSYLLQELGLFPWQTVLEAVSMPLEINGIKQGLDEKVSELLAELRLEDHKDKYMHQLSGGEKQRVALARTLVGESDLLLMDEPTSALDAMTKEELQSMIFKHKQRLSTTLIFVTHDIEEAVILGEKILILSEDGTLTMMDNNCFLIENPRERLEFYDECIKLRKRLKLES